MASNDSIESFVAITSSSAETAKFYLEMAEGDVAAAVDQYYASGGTEDGNRSVGHQRLQSAPVEAARTPPGPSPSKEVLRPKVQRGREKVMGFRDLQGSTDESDDDESNEYYTGGEKSGMVVKGGDGKVGNDPKDVDTYFDMLETAGAQRGRPEDLEQTTTRNAAFTGGARKLTEEGEQPEAASSSGHNARPEPGRPQVHTITFWKNNIFTVNNGEARRMTDPANRPFLEAISRGEAPQELMGGMPSSEIRVNCIRSNADYEAPPKSVAFTGRRQTLAGLRPETKASQPAPVIASSRRWEGVDPAQPTTSLQLRLADGSRMVARFNQGHTIADIRRFISASRPDLDTSYTFMTAFPSAELKDESAKLVDAGLLNAVVIQKAA